MVMGDLQLEKSEGQVEFENLICGLDGDENIRC
jgi:hypothetical protein